MANSKRSSDRWYCLIHLYNSSRSCLQQVSNYWDIVVEMCHLCSNLDWQKPRPFIRTIIASLLHVNPSLPDQYQNYILLGLYSSPILAMPLHLTGKDADIKAGVLDKNIVNNGDPILSSFVPISASQHLYISSSALHACPGLQSMFFPSITVNSS